MRADTFDPLESYHANFTKKSQDKIVACHSQYLRYSDLLQKCNTTRDIYNVQSEIADKSDLKIQEHMLSYERGEVDAASV